MDTINYHISMDFFKKCANLDTEGLKDNGRGEKVSLTFVKFE